MVLKTMFGQLLSQDELGRYYLNDIHRAVGGRRKDLPSNWKTTQAAQELIEHLAQTTSYPPLTCRKGGKNPGTYVTEELALHYAAWVGAEAYLEALKVFFRREVQEVGQNEVFATVVETINSLSLYLNDFSGK